MPISLKNGVSAKAVPPSLEEFETMYATLSQRYDEIVTIMHSAQLSDTYENAKTAAETVQGKAKIYVIDSYTTATGLGLIVQIASAKAEEGMSGSEIEDMIRKLLPRMYTVFFIEGLTYLQNSGYLGQSQALVGEYMKMLPMFILDSGHLVPTQKARNYRHLVDLLHEFLCEFTELDHVALLQGVPPFENETRALRERMVLDFENTPISEHTIGVALATIIGPRSLGMFVLQSEE
jgi:DegV family protein with EDD domain